MRRLIVWMIAACSHPIPKTGRGVVPSALVLRPATAASSSCVDAGAFEHARVIAALDRSLRTTGGYVLQLRDLENVWQSGAATIGTIGRGRSGERLMAVATVRCGERNPTFVIDSARAVFAAQPVVVARTHRAVTACDAECDGCGDALSARILGVEVPEGAHFEASRKIDVPMDIEVSVQPAADNCEPPY